MITRTYSLCLITLSFGIFSFLYFLLGVSNVYAETSIYRSAGWVSTDGAPQYLNTDGCQISSDGVYCSRQSTTAFGNLYFGSFGNLEEFGIPLNSTIDKLYICVKGKNSIPQYIGVVNAYNKTSWGSFCQTPSDLWSFFLGSTDNTIEKHTATSGNGLANCITHNNINFRNLTFRINSTSGSPWYANIDNFEIAFDYTRPIVTPTTVNFPEGQKGRIWEIGPDKTNLKNVSELDSIVAVASGTNHTLALKEDGTVWAWGSNQNGQLGKGSTGDSSDAPIQVKGLNGEGYLTGIKAIAAGSAQSIALKNDGTVWIWGQNSYGILGVGINDTFGNSRITTPMPVKTGVSGANLSSVTAIASGNFHSVALKSDGSVYTWGINDYGQLGIGCAGGNCSRGVYPAKILISDVKVIAAGGYHGLAIKNDGSLWGWGRTDQGELGRFSLEGGSNIALRPIHLSILSGLKNLSVMDRYNLALTEDGKVYEWGIGRSDPKHISELTDIKNISAGWPIFSPGVKGHALKQDGTLWQIYINDIPSKQVGILKNVTSIASGNQKAAVAVVGMAQDVLGDITTPTPTPTPSVSPTPAPFLKLPFDHMSKGKSFDKVALDPESWFDHEYPLANLACCTMSIVKYDSKGKRVTDAYKHHNGYDYSGSRNGAVDRSPVLAAASGIATFIPKDPDFPKRGYGNLIKITHTEGYQTWYGHLNDSGLITTDTNAKIPVVQGQPIGLVGSTGNSDGAHIHFTVVKDLNGDNIYGLTENKYGVVDPLGWVGKDEKGKPIDDPWTKYTGGDRPGEASHKLFIELAESVEQSITSAAVSTVAVDASIKVSLPVNSYPTTFKITANKGPYESQDDLISAMPSFYLYAFNNLGESIHDFLQPIQLLYNYTEADLSNIKQNTLKLFHFNNETEVWEPLPSTVDTENKTVIAYTNHFSHFALMGEAKDTVAPETQISINGQKGVDNWYRSNVEVLLNGQDNEGGLGMLYTFYSVDENQWTKYEESLNIMSEGEHIISYHAFDNADNKEEVKIYTLTIDKTAPVTTASVSGAEGEDGWFVSDVSVSLVAEDNGEVLKSEYSLDGGENYLSYGEPFTVSVEGSNEILYRAVDRAGNVEVAKSVQVKIDKTAPSSLVYTTGSFGKNGWYKSDVSLSLNALEDGSGYHKSFYSLDGENFVEYLDPLTIDAEGVTKVYYYSTDKAGNEEVKKVFIVKIDKTVPFAEIQYDIAAQDIKIIGRDNSANNISTSAIYTGTTGEVLIEDQAGHTLKLLVKDKEKGKNARLSVVSLQYNGTEIITMDKNMFSVKYDYFDATSNSIKKFDQDWKVNDQVRLSLSYSTDGDFTIVKNRISDGTVTTNQISGKKLLKVTTQNNTFKTSY